MKVATSLSALVARAASDPTSHRPPLVAAVKSIVSDLAIALAPTLEHSGAVIANDVIERMISDLPRLHGLSAKELSSWIVKNTRRATLARLVADYRPIVMSRIEHWLPGPLRSEAEDVWQHVCQVVDANHDRFEWWGERAFVGLLQRIAERRVWDRVKAWRHHPSRRVARITESGFEGADWLDPNIQTPSGVVAGNEANLQLQRILAEVLSPDEQQVIRLRFFEHCTVLGTADTLNKSESAIKMMTKRALAKLRDRLGPSSEDLL